MSNLNSIFYFKKIVPCPVTVCLGRSSFSIFIWASFKYWKASIRSLWSLLFSRFNSPNSFSLPSCKRCSSPLNFLVVLLLYTFSSLIFLLLIPNSTTPFWVKINLKPYFKDFRVQCQIELSFCISLRKAQGITLQMQDILMSSQKVLDKYLEEKSAK